MYLRLLHKKVINRAVLEVKHADTMQSNKGNNQKSKSKRQDYHMK